MDVGPTCHRRYMYIYIYIYKYISWCRRTIYDAYNDRNVILTERDLEIIRRMQAGAFAHPEFEAEAVRCLIYI